MGAASRTSGLKPAPLSRHVINLGVGADYCPKRMACPRIASGELSNWRPASSYAVFRSPRCLSSCGVSPARRRSPSRPSSRQKGVGKIGRESRLDGRLKLLDRRVKSAPVKIRNALTSATFLARRLVPPAILQ